MAQLTAQLTWISLLAACALVMQRHLSPASAEKLLRKWLATERVRWQYERVENNSGVPTETALTQLWQSAGLTINWEETCAATNLAPRIAMRRGGTAPGRMVWSSHDPRAVRPVSQLGGNFLVHGIRVAREDVERQLQLEGYAEPLAPAATSSASIAPPAPPSATSDAAAEKKLTCFDWVSDAVRDHPRAQKPPDMSYSSYLLQFAPEDWSVRTISNELGRLARLEGQATRGKGRTQT